MLKTFIASAIFSVLLLFSIESLASLQVFPTRILLTDQQTAAQISVRHKGEKPANYKISLVFYEMKKDGTMVQLASPQTTDQSAIDYIKYSPRKISLKPDEEQVVRILTSHTSTLKDGEYRAHIYFESMDEPDEAANPAGDGKGAQLFLKARMAVAVPIIIRRGITDSKVAMSDFSIIKGADQKLAFVAKIQKTGSRNVYGDFKINWRNASGATSEVGTVNGVSSYVDERFVNFPLIVQDENILREGVVTAEFREPAADGGKVLATAQFQPSPSNTKTAESGEKTLAPGEPIVNASILRRGVSEWSEISELKSLLGMTSDVWNVDKQVAFSPEPEAVGTQSPSANQ